MLTLRIPEPPTGERYAGLVIGLDGKPSHHLFLIATRQRATHAQAQEFAASVGGRRPSRQEGAILWATFGRSLDISSCWLEEQHPGDPGNAFVQNFGNGYQGWDRKGNEFGAVAVRSVAA